MLSLSDACTFLIPSNVTANDLRSRKRQECFFLMKLQVNVNSHEHSRGGGITQVLLSIVPPPHISTTVLPVKGLHDRHGQLVLKRQEA